ncbi:MAG TPA: ABC transporter permease [Acidimicrobiia bacterium]|nr:ABC transporter permease [Acidimicrobiia bacterium]
MAADQGLRASVARTSGFLARELRGVFRQPRLILTLILAPFAILLIFGLGYRTDPPPFRTLLVLPSDNAGFAVEEEDFDEAFGDAIDLVGTTTDVTDARAQLRGGDVDILIIGPGDAITSIEEGERAEFLVVHSEADPVIRSSITLLARLSVDELNRLVLTEVVATGQSQAEEADVTIDTLRDSTTSLVSALESEDAAAADEARDTILDSLNRLETETIASGALLEAVGEALGTEQADLFADLRTQLEATSGDSAIDSARQFEEDLATLEDALDRLLAIDPDLLVRPFGVTVEDISTLPDSPALYYAPGALIILVQHLAITFASLSLVRERQLGLTELFRVSPLKPTEILVGKFIAFVVIAGTVAAVLTGAMLAFGLAIRGDPVFFVLTLVLVISASVGLGFVLSAVSKTDTQAVQYTMIVLLASIFFTGFMIPLGQLVPAVRVVSYLIPGTYGIEALEDIMFGGLTPNRLVIAGLTLYALVLLVVSWFVMRRHVRTTDT